MVHLVLVCPNISGGGYTQKELEAFRPIIYNNLVSQMKILIEASSILNCPMQESNLVRENASVRRHEWRRKTSEDNVWWPTRVWRRESVRERHMSLRLILT